MSYQNIAINIDQKIATITLNRPEKLNALNRRTLEELSDSLESLRENQSVRIVVVTGSGEKAFAAGADITEINNLDQEQGATFAAFGQNVFRKLETIGKPVIAAVNGFALGGGCELAMACHIRIASDNAKFGQPEVNLGLIAGYGGTQRLPRLVGLSNANYLLLTGEIIDAKRAKMIGLVSEVLPQDKLRARTIEIANTLISKAPLALKNTLEATYNGLHCALDEAMAVEAKHFGNVCSTEDMQEGTSAFLEKRKPNFKGQ